MNVACVCECIHPYSPECAGEKGAMDSFPARLRQLSLALSNDNNIDSWMKNSNHISDVLFCGDNESGIALLSTAIFEYSFSIFYTYVKKCTVLLKVISGSPLKISVFFSF